jgi:hypothetical protein
LHPSIFSSADQAWALATICDSTPSSTNPFGAFANSFLWDCIQTVGAASTFSHPADSVGSPNYRAVAYVGSEATQDAHFSMSYWACPLFSSCHWDPDGAWPLPPNSFASLSGDSTNFISHYSEIDSAEVVGEECVFERLGEICWPTNSPATVTLADWVSDASF